jgi:phosphoglycolate phosphatase
MAFSVDLLIFDLDGTLCDTKEDIATAVNGTLRELGLSEKPRERIYSYVGGGVRKLIQQAVGEESGDRFERAMKVFRRHYMDHLLDTTRPYPGMEGILDHYGGKKKAVVTNKPHDYTGRILSGLGLDVRFDLIVGGENGLPLKPAPDMILHVVDRLDIRKDRCVMIGDGMSDIRASRTAGVRVCAVGYGLGDADELMEAEPDFFCRTPEELLCHFE